VLAHIDRYQNIEKYYGMIRDMRDDEDFLEYVNKPLTQEEENIIQLHLDMEQKHFSKIWQIINKFSRSWWN
jgi:hypothetical protein